jgi:carbamoyl-phosphate synthase large subunit
VGHTLDELKNEITKTTPASFEPTIDYVVTKIPRFTFEKFSTSPVILGTSMKSVGEVMAIGRNFKESLQKALVSLEIGFSGLDRIFELNKNQIEKKLKENIPNKILLIAEAFRKKINIKKIQRLSKIDNWFLEQIKEIVDTENEIIKIGLPKNYVEFNRIKSIGFSDKKLSQLTKIPEMIVRKKRTALKVIPVFKKVDTCAAEFKSFTPYMYSTYQRNFSIKSECEANPSSKRKIIILGGGPNRIGQGIEFDYCCCQASFALREVDIETIMINCNPETVSTDFDTSDRLYFEPLTLEDVLAIVEVENPSGVIVQFGGQTPLNLAAALAKAGVPIIGTSPDAIDQAEDRERFQQMIHKLGLLQPANRIIRNIDEGLAAAEEIGYPLVDHPAHMTGVQQVDSQSLLLLLILHQYF